MARVFGRDAVGVPSRLRSSWAPFGGPADKLGDARRDPSPGGLAPLPASVTGGARIDCDRRLVTDVGGWRAASTPWWRRA